MDKIPNSIATVNNFQPKYFAQQCPVCNGFGTLRHGTKTCQACTGLGYVIVPTGVVDGEMYGQNQKNI